MTPRLAPQPRRHLTRPGFFTGSFFWHLLYGKQGHRVARQRNRVQSPASVTAIGTASSEASWRKHIVMRANDPCSIVAIASRASAPYSPAWFSRCRSSARRFVIGKRSSLAPRTGAQPVPQLRTPISCLGNGSALSSPSRERQAGFRDFTDQLKPSNSAVALTKAPLCPRQYRTMPVKSDMYEFLAPEPRPNSSHNVSGLPKARKTALAALR